MIFVTTPTQPQHNLNLVGFDMIIAVYTTTPPPGTPSNAASDQPLILPKQQQQQQQIIIFPDAILEQFVMQPWL